MARRKLPARTGSDGHLRSKRIALGVAGSNGLVLGFELPGKVLTTYRISLKDARSLLAELPKTIKQAEALRGADVT
jgi:hypothetical protein